MTYVPGLVVTFGHMANLTEYSEHKREALAIVAACGGKMAEAARTRGRAASNIAAVTLIKGMVMTVEGHEGGFKVVNWTKSRTRG